MRHIYEYSNDRKLNVNVGMFAGSSVPAHVGLPPALFSSEFPHSDS